MLEGEKLTAICKCGDGWQIGLHVVIKWFIGLLWSDTGPNAADSAGERGGASCCSHGPGRPPSAVQLAPSKGLHKMGSSWDAGLRASSSCPCSLPAHERLS